MYTFLFILLLRQMLRCAIIKLIHIDINSKICSKKVPHIWGNITQNPLLHKVYFMKQWWSYALFAESKE